MPSTNGSSTDATQEMFRQWLGAACYPATNGLDLWRQSLASYQHAALRSVSPFSLWGEALLDAMPRTGGDPDAETFPTYPPGKTLAELSVGDTASLTKSITQREINEFARISGDDNPAHVNEEWASTTRLKTRVAHGMLTAGLISAALGTVLPGPGSIYMSQSLRWVAPVYPGDELTAVVTIKKIDTAKKRVVIDTVVEKAGTPVLTGEALVMPPSE